MASRHQELRDAFRAADGALGDVRDVAAAIRASAEREADLIRSDAQRDAAASRREAELYRLKARQMLEAARERGRAVIAEAERRARFIDLEQDLRARTVAVEAPIEPEAEVETFIDLSVDIGFAGVSADHESAGEAPEVNTEFDHPVHGGRPHLVPVPDLDDSTAEESALEELPAEELPAEESPEPEELPDPLARGAEAVRAPAVGARRGSYSLRRLGYPTEWLHNDDQDADPEVGVAVESAVDRAIARSFPELQGQ